MSLLSFSLTLLEKLEQPELLVGFDANDVFVEALVSLPSLDVFVEARVSLLSLELRDCAGDIRTDTSS